MAYTTDRSSYEDTVQRYTRAPEDGDFPAIFETSPVWDGAVCLGIDASWERRYFQFPSLNGEVYVQKAGSSVVQFAMHAHMWDRLGADLLSGTSEWRP